jgi:DNA-binding transcriptional ArsR family regulator
MNGDPISLGDYEKVFAALAHQARRDILLMLSQLGGELPSGYLARRFQHSWPTTTRHLRVLEEAGLVEVHHEGRTNRYHLKRDRLTHVLSAWLDLFVPVGPERTWTSTAPRSTSEMIPHLERNPR